MHNLEIPSWKDLERHPLSAEYKNITGRAREECIASLKEHGILNNRPVIIHEEKVIDGWQFLGWCREADIKPEFQQLELPEGMTARQWVRVTNDNRRQMSQYLVVERTTSRRIRVAKARDEGKSTWIIAQEEDVSQQTILRDLEFLATHGTPEEETQDADENSVDTPVSTENAKKKSKRRKKSTTGKDGKTYGKSKKVKCDRCSRLNHAVKGCEACKRASAEAAQKKKDEAEAKKAAAALKKAQQEADRQRKAEEAEAKKIEAQRLREEARKAKDAEAERKRLEKEKEKADSKNAKEEAKAKKKADERKERVANAKDKNGIKWPDVALPSIDAAEDLNELRTTVIKALDLVKKLQATPIINSMEFSSISSYLKQIKDRCNSGKPTHICPYCDGTNKNKGGPDKGKKCNVCKGDGWVTTSLYESAPSEYKKGAA